MPSSYVAVDLGAESGRVCLGRFDGRRLSLGEAFRFAHSPVSLPTGLYWNMMGIFQSVHEGLRHANLECGSNVCGIGVDSWAVDFALFDSDGRMLEGPHSYRDNRTLGMMERACERMPPENMYATSGIQLIRINTLYQLLSMEGSEQLSVADRLLMIPDIVNYWLSGEMVGECTNASTTQLYDVTRREWSQELISDSRIPSRIFGPLNPPGAQVGKVHPRLASEVGLSPNMPVLAVASHDTASAVVAIPADTEDFGYISSGTWSLVGVELNHPVLTEDAMRAGFTNEEGFGPKTRFLKNVMGLWLLQECRREWSEAVGEAPSYEDLTRWAETVEDPVPLIDPDCPEFLSSGPMQVRISAFCQRTGQTPPRNKASFVRTILESLALKYRWTLHKAEVLTGKPIKTVHVVGGGSRNRLLCRMTASATNRLVMAGPAEATTIGNVMVQAWARGEVASTEDIRALVRESFPLQTYEPDNRAEWEERYGRFLEVLNRATTEPVLVGGNV